MCAQSSPMSMFVAHIPSGHVVVLGVAPRGSKPQQRNAFIHTFLLLAKHACQNPCPCILTRLLTDICLPRASLCSTTDLKTLPGISAPFDQPFFDPLNLSKGAKIRDVRRWRESEIVHGRVAMLAALG